MASIFTTALAQVSKGIKFIKPATLVDVVTVVGECRERHSR